MLIKHVSILNLEKTGNNCLNNTNHYSMRVYLSNNPDQTWKRHFSNLWRKVFFYKRKRMEFHYNEIRVLLEKSDDLQKYIESIKGLVERSNKQVISEQRKRKTEHKRKLKISNSLGAKTYKII